MRRLTVVAMALAAAGCGGPATPSVADAWVRLPAVPGRPAAAYFTIRGGSADAALIAVRAAGARRAELHESMAHGMRPIGSVPVPAGGTTGFAPGGRHVMLFDLDPRLAPGRRIALALVLADGRTLQTDATLVAAGDQPPR